MSMTLLRILPYVPARDFETIKWLEVSFDKLGYSLIIKKNNLSLAEVKWQIIPPKNDSCELLIQLDIIKNSLLKNYPNFLRWFIIKVIIKPKMKSYLKSVISGVGFYAETGIAVKKNQFGRNMIFS